jgi:CoA transferase family III
MRDIAAHLWSLLDGDPAKLEHLELVGERRLLPSVFDVTGVATAAVGVATLAAAELGAARGGRLHTAHVGTREAVAAFRSENLFTPLGWSLPPPWDPIAGDYPTADGWIRLHTNYRSHRDAVLRALELRDADQDRVAAAVADCRAEELETRVVDEGGAAAVMRRRDDWLAHPHGRATISAPPVQIVSRREESLRRLASSARPLDGIRVLDLTRVIAGPLGTRFLAAWGADVLRVDPPGFEEVPAFVPEASAGKRCTALDLKTAAGRDRLVDLIRRADVLVHGYRPGALAALGFDDDFFHEINPSLIVSQHNATASCR